MHYLELLVLFSLAIGALDVIATPIAPNWNNMHTKHRWNAVPEKWESIGHPPVGTTIDLRIALRPQRESALVDALYEVSNPKHVKYGAYLSKEQVAELVAPHPHSFKVSRSHGGSWLTVAGVPVSKANDILGASYQLYQHAGSNETILRTIGYALPSVLHMHVRTVAPTTYFGSLGTLQQTPRVYRGGAATALTSRDPKQHVSVSTLRSLYKSVAYIPVATDRNVLGITGFLGQFAGYEDLTTFMGRYRTEGKDATFTVKDINNSGYDANKPGSEANLDMQFAQGIAWPTPHVFYSTGGLSPEFIPDSFTPENDHEPFLDWLNYMINLPEVPQTISTSYGGNEQTFPPEYAKSVCDLFLELSSRGVSLLFASGDSGVGGGDCKKNDGSDVVQFQPVFPATCPYVTSVGGTTLGTTRRYAEVAAKLSSGGFSNFFARPPYQNDAVTNFFQQLGGKYAGLYNASSRGFPDVSAQALNLLSIHKDRILLVEGTSCSAPIVAGLISLLNDYRLSKDRPPLGFLNPLLYGEARRGFNDIMSGANGGCNTEGFSAVPGWDPVTGLGTPDFNKLLDIIF